MSYEESIFTNAEIAREQAREFHSKHDVTATESIDDWNIDMQAAMKWIEIMDKTISSLTWCFTCIKPRSRLTSRCTACGQTLVEWEAENPDAPQCMSVPY